MNNRRSPCGERGLKSLMAERLFQLQLSLPVRGAWIEICHKYKCTNSYASLPVRGAWIEIFPLQPFFH